MKHKPKAVLIMSLVKAKFNKDASQFTHISNEFSSSLFVQMAEDASLIMPPPLPLGYSLKNMQIWLLITHSYSMLMMCF